MNEPLKEYQIFAESGNQWFVRGRKLSIDESGRIVIADNYETVAILSSRVSVILISIVEAPDESEGEKG